MTNQEYKQFLADKALTDIPTGFFPGPMRDCLAPFQKEVVTWACRRGRAALFEDTGLGKTRQQVEWARLVHEYTGGDVLIVAPLAVASQTVEEASSIGVTVRYCRNGSQVQPGLTIINYEMLPHFDPSRFVGVVLDESSILKHHDSKTRALLIEMFSRTPYRLSCTATPSPNDWMELGNQAEFLGVMSAAEMLAMFFVHDGGSTQNWRLKGHGKTRFWKWMASWAICIRNPADLGFDGSSYNLPPLIIHEHLVAVDQPADGDLFIKPAVTLTERRAAKKQSLAERVRLAADLVNNSIEEWVVWCHLNDESSELTKAIPGAVEVTGAMIPDEKIARLNKFSHGEARVIVSKASICGWGLNWQHCRNVLFVGLDDSFEAYYQAVRRCYRFGQNRPVNVHLVRAETEGAIKANLERKQQQAIEMAEGMVAHMRELTKSQIKGAIMEKADYKRDLAQGEDWDLHLGDCVDVVSELPDSYLDYSVFSPPFASLYTYSNSDRDMGNCKDAAEFYQHFKFLVAEMFRAMKPGRLVSFHCMNLPTSKFRDGFIGIRDFRGELIRTFEDAGWIFHSEVCIWKDPVTSMQRTKAIGLLHKQLKKDSALSRQGIPDYLVTMRKPGENPNPITHTDKSFPVALWQRYASPVWMDINPSRTLQYRQARENDDERHIAPLQLDVVERAIGLWTNPGDLVLSPFAGIGSEGFVALQMGRRFVGAELKRSYWDAARRNLESARRESGDLFDDIGVRHG